MVCTFYQKRAADSAIPSSSLALQCKLSQSARRLFGQFGRSGPSCMSTLPPLAEEASLSIIPAVSGCVRCRSGNSKQATFGEPWLRERCTVTCDCQRRSGIDHGTSPNLIQRKRRMLAPQICSATRSPWCLTVRASDGKLSPGPGRGFCWKNSDRRNASGGCARSDGD